ncbi:MAG TPA: hypothetical protein VKX33_03950 [Cyclobacteriaceae bacterium]|nr:hypothetical protein [Cyclobacteriaceae bacterium]
MKAMVVSESRINWMLLNSFATVALFLFIYVPSFIFFPINVSYLIILLALAYISYRNNLNRFLTLYKQKSFLTYLLLYSFCVFYILLIPTFSDWPFDNTFLVTYLRLLIDLLLVLPFFLFIFCYDLDYDMDDFLNLIVKIGVIQGGIAVVMFIVPGLRELVFNYIIALPSEKLVDQPYRGYGISGDFYFSSPLFQGLVFVVNSILYLKHSKKRYLFFYPFILVSMVLNARVTLVVVPIFFAVIFFASFYYDNLRWLRKFSGLSLFFMIIASAIVVYFVFNPEKAQAIIWIMEGVIGGIGALSGNLTESKTLSIILSGHLHFPQRQFNLWFGEGLVVFANLNAPVRSDLGYIRYIYYGGIVLSVLFYFSLINFSINRILKTTDPLIKVLLLTLLITTFVVHFKGDIFNSSAYLKGFLLLLMLTVYGTKTTYLNAK